MKTKTFARTASGLVRSMSAWDALVYNVVFMAPMSVFVYGIWASLVFPGTDLPATALMCIPLAIVIGLFYAIYSSAMPRSGGDYIWVSRILHPALGFMISLFLFLVLQNLVGVEISWVLTYAVAPYYHFIGRPDMAAWITSPEIQLGLSIIYYLACAAIISRGAKTTAKVFWVCFALILVGLLTYSGALLATGPANFQANFNARSGMNYDAVVSTAKAAGWPGMSLSATLLGVEFTFMNFLGFTSSAYVSGEIKEVRKSQLLAIVGAVIVFGLITWFSYQVTYYTMGGEFIGSISQLAATGDPSYALPSMPFFMYLFQYATQSPLVYAIFLLGWSMMAIAAGLTYMFTGVRLIFAWSFDRVLPTALSKVDSKYNSPYVALIATTVLAILFQVAWIYTNLAGFFAYIVFGWMVMQIVAGISGIIFPYRRKDIFESSPPIVKKKVAGVPVLSILGVLTIVISFWLGYASLGPSFVGQLDWTVFGFTILLFVAGLIIYAISSAYHKSKGIPLELTFKEIPPE